MMIASSHKTLLEVQFKILNKVRPYPSENCCEHKNQFLHCQCFKKREFQIPSNVERSERFMWKDISKHGTFGSRENQSTYCPRKHSTEYLQTYQPVYRRSNSTMNDYKMQNRFHE